MAEPRSSRAIRRLTNLPWWLPVVLGAVLALDACALSPFPPATGSPIARWLHVGGPSTRTRDPDLWPFVIVRGPDGENCFDLAPLGCFDYEGELVLQTWLTSASVQSTGLWGITCRTTSVAPPSEFLQLPSPQRAEFAQIMDDALAASGEDATSPLRVAARMLRDGTYTTTEVNPSGYIHNTLAIALVLAFLWSCTLGHPWRSWQAVWHDYHLARGRCPNCGYPVHEYPGTICPECGLDWADPAPTAP